jgi:hypothetical protein
MLSLGSSGQVKGDAIFRQASSFFMTPGLNEALGPAAHLPPDPKSPIGDIRLRGTRNSHACETPAWGETIVEKPFFQKSGCSPTDRQQKGQAV